jgi:hypothetical protein
MDKIVLEIAATPTATTTYYGELFIEALQFGQIMMIIGILSGILIGFGLYKLYLRGKNGRAV